MTNDGNMNVTDVLLPTRFDFLRNTLFWAGQFEFHFFNVTNIQNCILHIFVFWTAIKER